MKLQKLLAMALSVASTVAFANFAHAESGKLSIMAINGEDNRQELSQAQSKWREIGRSLAGKVSNEAIRNSGASSQLVGLPLNKKMCPGTRFSEQITVPTCTGFLVKSNVLVTAAHCIKEENDCTGYSWVFEYALSNPQESSANYTKVENNRIYKCTKILGRNYQNFGNIDYAILQLDRPVEGRNPLQMGWDLPLLPGQAVTNIGHSSGLPLKFKDSANILRITPDGLGIDTDLDLFHGDSGSPVFDDATGMVIGITSHGHADSRHEDGKVCSALRICRPEDNCYPSTSSRISNLKADPVFKTLFQ